ncbi:MAG TPA: hypothetical protein VF201_04745 [Nitrolancea sp.]
MDEIELDWQQVTDRESFFTFVRALIADRMDSLAQEAKNPSSPRGPATNGWENTSIEAFLEAALAWAKDTHMGESLGLDGEPSWRFFALFLEAGKFYE